MSLILNPRGTSGSGKTELARRLVASYAGAPCQASCGLVTVHDHPAGGTPLAVIGSYARRSGGCDSVSLKKGGLDAAFAAAAEWAERGCDVLLEGNRVSLDVDRTQTLAGGRTLVILHIEASPELCAINLQRRRRIGSSAVPRLVEQVSVEQRALRCVIGQLRSVTSVFSGEFDDALIHARDLLNTTAPGLATGASTTSGGIIPGAGR